MRLLAEVKKEQRHESILSSLKTLGFLSRSQIQRLHRLGSVRNANRILSDLRPYLNVIKRAEYVYTLNAEGRRRIGASATQMRATQVDHHLMRNQLYIALGCPSTWRAEVRLKVNGEVSVIADAVYTKDGRYVIIEVDNTQKMAVNRGKVAKYKRLLALNVFEKKPYFIWLTTTEYRRKELTKMCDGMNARILTIREVE